MMGVCSPVRPVKTRVSRSASPPVGSRRSCAKRSRSRAGAPLPVVDTWAGLRPRAADGLPVLGPCGEIDGLFYATGHYRNGILLAPLTGELISESIVAGKASPLLAPFSPDRFSSQPVVSV